MTYTNKRKYPRKKDRLLVQLHGKDFQIYTNATDIGLGGAFINTLYLLNEGTYLNVKLQLPESERTLDIRGKVVRQVTDSDKGPTMDHIGMAIEFTDLSSESAELIENMMNTN